MVEQALISVLFAYVHQFSLHNSKSLTRLIIKNLDKDLHVSPLYQKI